MSYGTIPYGDGTPGEYPAATACLTVGNLIDRTFDLLLQSAREERNKLGQYLDSTATTFTVEYPLMSLTRGTYLAIDDEVMYVWDTSPGSGGASTVTVERGDKGTIAATHELGSIIAVNPYFTRYHVRKTLQDEIRSWGPQVFQVLSADIDAVNFQRGYDLGILGDWFYILDVIESPDPLTGIVNENSWNRVNYRIDKNANLQSFPSGAAIFITDPLGVFDTPRSFHVTYAAPIDVDTSFEDNDCVHITGMDNSDLDIPPLGAAWRLATGREVRRMLTEAQGQNSDLTNFPAGYMVKAGEDFKNSRDSRLKDAQERLRAQYPIRRTS